VVAELGHVAVPRPPPAEELASPCGRVIGTQLRAGPQRGFHVPHEESYDRAGALSTRGPRCHQTEVPCPPVGVCRFTAASPWTPPATSHRWSFPRRGIIEGSRVFTRPVFPIACGRCGTANLGLDRLSFAPRRYQRRTSGWGQAIEHGPGLHLRHRRPPIEYPLNSCDLVSHLVTETAERAGPMQAAVASDVNHATNGRIGTPRGTMRGSAPVRPGDTLGDSLWAVAAFEQPSRTNHQGTSERLTRSSEPVRISSIEPYVSSPSIRSRVTGGHPLPRGRPVPSVFSRCGQFDRRWLHRVRRGELSSVRACTRARRSASSRFSSVATCCQLSRLVVASRR
jgi:hypothetical protein